MKTQKFIWENNIGYFYRELNKFLNDGWTVVPTTMIVIDDNIGCVIEKETVDKP